MRPPDVSEAAWQATVVEALRLFGWRFVHFRPAQDRRGRWSTPLQGDAGFPDLIAVRDGWMLALELKADKGRTSPDQRAWIADLFHVPGVLAAVVRPRDWRWLETAMRRPDLADVTPEA